MAGEYHIQSNGHWRLLVVLAAALVAGCEFVEPPSPWPEGYWPGSGGPGRPTKLVVPNFEPRTDYERDLLRGAELKIAQRSGNCVPEKQVRPGTKAIGGTCEEHVERYAALAAKYAKGDPKHCPPVSPEDYLKCDPRWVFNIRVSALVGNFYNRPDGKKVIPSEWQRYTDAYARLEGAERFSALSSMRLPKDPVNIGLNIVVWGCWSLELFRLWVARRQRKKAEQQPVFMSGFSLDDFIAEYNKRKAAEAKNAQPSMKALPPPRQQKYWFD